jgi:hypothetical protein
MLQPQALAEGIQDDNLYFATEVRHRFINTVSSTHRSDEFFLRQLSLQLATF